MTVLTTALLSRSKLPAKGRVEIQAKGVVTGEVHSPCLVIDPGGIFDGRCHMLAASDTATAPSVTIPIRALSQA